MLLPIFLMAVAKTDGKSLYNGSLSEGQVKDEGRLEKCGANKLIYDTSVPVFRSLLLLG